LTISFQLSGNPAVSLLIRHRSANGEVLCGIRDDEDISWYYWPWNHGRSGEFVI